MPDKILLIENDHGAREIMRIALERNGYEVVTSDNGVSGYDMSFFIKPDLIVTAIGPNGMDGMGVLRRVRGTALLEHIPVIVTTAFGTGSATFALQQGANGFEPKPIDAHSLLCTVRRLLGNRRSKKAA
jgi:two-component system chemotaxis response regulator CheY